jgi:hypothetical protein
MRRFWTPEEDEQLKALYSNTKSEDIAKLLDRSVNSIHSRAFIFGLKKSHEFVAEMTATNWKKGKHKNSVANHFNKGQKPWNTGRKGYMGPNKTSFVPGQKPHNWRPLGSTREVNGYEEIKVAEGGVWKQKHVHIWEQANGPVPKKHVVVFKDGNAKNFNLDNLQLLTMKENMLRNSIQNYPEEIKSTIRVLTKLNKTISNYGKK